MTSQPAQKDHRRVETLAGFYGLYLIQRGLAPDEAAARVIARYPAMRPKLQMLVDRKTSSATKEPA